MQYSKLLNLAVVHHLVHYAIKGTFWLFGMIEKKKFKFGKINEPI